MTSSGSGGLEARGRELSARLRAVMARGVERDLPEEEFRDLALRVFRFQVDAVPAYGSWVRSRASAEVDRWTRIPPVPARAFRELPMVGGDPTRVEAVFRTSGTTGGKGEHRVRDLGLYEAAILPNARAHLAPRAPGSGDEALRVVALLPHPDDRPDSSLAYMAGVLARAWDPEGGTFLADGEWGLDAVRVRRVLDAAAGGLMPTLVIGTAFAFVRLADLAGEEGWGVTLPPGSRVMETGGFKGRSREVSRPELYGGISRVLGVPVDRIVNEYGMTELLSQFYEPVLREGADRAAGAPPEDRRLVGPPWVRTRILNPETLEPVEDGRPGLLCHLDLANLHSVSAVLTEDLGVAVPGGFRVLGRTPGAEPRGCSLAMEELLASRERAGR